MARNRKSLQQITAIEEPPVNDPGRKPRTDIARKERRAERNKSEDPNAQEPGKDRVWGVASRDRWPDSSAEINEERNTTSSEDDGGEEEEATGGAALTVAQLKEALDGAGVEYASNAKKADLVELYDANISEE